MPTLLRHPVALALSAIALLLLIGSTIAIVPETKQGVIVRFGDPKKIINRYQPNEDFGKTGAGVILRWPFIDQMRPDASTLARVSRWCEEQGVLPESLSLGTRTLEDVFLELTGRELAP